ncbi:hypothetical protein ACFX1Z_024273 [Malus domestica]
MATPPAVIPDVTMTQIEEEEEEAPQQDNPNSEPPQSQSKTLTLEPHQDQEIQLNPPLQSEPNPKPKSDDIPARSPRGTTTTTTTTITFFRRGTKQNKSGSKRKAASSGNRKAQQKAQQKLQTQRETLNPIPFVPSKHLDFEKHEKLLKWLNLWDFVHIEFDRNLRVDLLAQLISNFNPNLRGSYVNGSKVMVNRADLARALKLPSKQVKKGGAVALPDGAEEPPAEAASEESIAFIEELVSNWVLLHEDTWMMPSEVLNWTKAIKEGQFVKVDWAGLIWFMVEKELVQAPKLGDCYYASHLQCLIKSQREDLFMVKEQETPLVDVDAVDVDAVDVDAVDVDAKEEEEEEEEDGGMDVKMVGEDDLQGPSGLEEHNIELCLGQDNVDTDDLKQEQDNVEKTDVRQELDIVDVADVRQDNVDRTDVGQENLEKAGVEKEQVGVEDVMGFEECKVEEPGHWLLDGKSSANEPFLQRCNLGVVNLSCGEEGKKDMEFVERIDEGNEEEEEEEEDEDEEEQEEGGFHLSLKDMPLEGFHAMEAAHNPLSSDMSMRDQFAGEFLSSRDDSRMLPGSSSFFGNGGLKREFVHENANSSHHPLNGNKRLRMGGPWDGKVSGGEFDTCLEQVQHWIEKAKMVYAEKEQVCEQSMVGQQMLLDELHQREEVIGHLQKAKAEEQQKSKMEMYRLEHELYVMGNLLDGYRKALKETQKAFAEYRARCPQADEPLYRDVPGSGGLVLSTMELEKQRLKKEEEERMTRLLLEKQIKDFEAGWISKFEAHPKSVELLSNRLQDAESEVKVLIERLAKRRIPEIPELEFCKRMPESLVQRWMGWGRNIQGRSVFFAVFVADSSLLLNWKSVGFVL